MSLTAYEFKGSYNRIDDNIAEDFYMPCMSESVTYDRISGYFGSTVYIVAWKALKQFISNGGRIRIVCSPVLSEEDRIALQEGDSAQADGVLANALEKELHEMLDDENLRLPARLLACLVSQGIIEVRIGIVSKDGHPNTKALFHDKIGIFTDKEGNSVGFRGSFNETYKGLSNDGNIESADVFQSWDGGKELQRVVDSHTLFERVWNGEVSQSVLIYRIPEITEKAYFTNYEKEDVDKLLDEIKIRAAKEQKWKPSAKGRTPRLHQENALDNWVNNKRRGVLKHATGSGKTFTAICAINNALERDEAVLVLVPSKELLYQWKCDVEASLEDKQISFLLCGDGNNTWKRPGELRKWTEKAIGIKRVVIAIMTTAANDEFIKNIEDGSHLFVVADEVHNLGSKKRRNIFRIEAGARLGLSATPERYGDSEGTDAIFDYFGPIIQPEFSLEDAIRTHVLTRYFYHPLSVYLTASEQDEWDSISNEIAKIVARTAGKGNDSIDIFKSNPRLSQLMINRARILKNAENKTDLAVKVIREEYRKGQKWIVYCDNQQQLKEIRNRIEDAGYDAYEYYAEMKGDRVETLRYFERQGGILVSIKCLDEGVDIPSTTHAMILASSRNPREFIQRRGRVLRLSPGKTFAHLYDTITLPNGVIDGNDRQNSIVVGELARAIQFGTWAENPSCITNLKLISLAYGMDYHEHLSKGDENDEDEQ